MLLQPVYVQFMRKICKSVVLVVAYVTLTGCISSIGSRDIEAPAIYLSPAGWQDNHLHLREATFTEYAQSITEEVRRYRIPFNPENADAEVSMASPVELPLEKHCEGRANGIAVLVHGLSDTAFSLRDVGRVMADVCFRSRIILLPGHGTRAGDLLTTRLSDWQQTLHYLIDQAAAETDVLVLIGFSLGGVLTLDAALKKQDVVDGVIGISPAYHLSSARIARWANIGAPFVRWVDRGVADDSMRYEAMPTRGVAETWSAIKTLERRLDRYGPVEIPWMLAQSMDDAVIVPSDNEALWREHALNPESRLIRFVSTQEFPEEEGVVTLPGSSETDQVIALTHLAIHQSPENPRYGKHGTYRNCGGNMPRAGDAVEQCEQSEKVWYGLWTTEPEPGQAVAFSTFNPSFDQLAEEIKSFARGIVNTATVGGGS